MYILNINFCEQISPLIQLVGQALNIFKISIPLILICLGIFDIGKAVISSKADDVKKNIKLFIKKMLISVLIFFIPMICMVTFGFVDGFNKIKNESGIDYDICYDCMFNPNSHKCRNAVEIANLNP